MRRFVAIRSSSPNPLCIFIVHRCWRHHRCRELIRIRLMAAILVCCTLSLVASAAVRVDDLRCEYLMNPNGIDVTAPRLSWKLSSDERGQRQTAFRIIVATTAAKLARDEGDLCDSGRVESDQSI